MKSEYKQRPFDFKRRVVKIVYDKNKLILEEQRFLNFIKPSECGIRYYNTTLCSNTPSMRGKKHSQETRKKISESNKGKFVSEETRKKISDSHKGKKHTENFKMKMSLRNVGNKYGSVPRSQEFKENASRKMKEYWRNKNAIHIL